MAVPRVRSLEKIERLFFFFRGLGEFSKSSPNVHSCIAENAILILSVGKEVPINRAATCRNLATRTRNEGAKRLSATARLPSRRKGSKTKHGREARKVK